MGVGNWAFRNTAFPQSNYSIGDSGVDYGQEREEALEAVKRHIEANPAIFEPFKDEHDLGEMNDLGWFFENLEEVTDDLGLEHLNVSQEIYVGEDSSQRYDELKEALQSQVASDPSIAECWKWAETLRSGHNSEFRVVAEGRFAEVGLKHWENSYFVGVQPKYQLENYEDAISGRSFDPSTGKIEGSDPAMFLKVQQVLATAALVVEPNNEDFKALALSTAVQADLDDIFGDAPSYKRSATCVGEALLELAETSVENGDEDYFKERFGIEPDDFLGAKPIIELVQAVWDEVGDMPQTIINGYAQEFARADALVLGAMYGVDPVISTPKGAWSSQRVDYTPPDADQPAVAVTAERQADESPAPGM